jgi:hypothetical protein
MTATAGISGSARARKLTSIARITGRRGEMSDTKTYTLRDFAEEWLNFCPNDMPCFMDESMAKSVDGWCESCRARLALENDNAATKVEG